MKTAWRRTRRGKMFDCDPRRVVEQQQQQVAGPQAGEEAGQTRTDQRLVIIMV